MNSSDAELWDWMRIFIGEVPPIFLLEVVLRIFVLYLLLVLSMRIMGKRMSALISRNEMIAMVSLAAAIGIPVQDPENGLLPPFIIAGVVIGVQRIVSTQTMKSPRFESLVVGQTGPLVEDGLLQLKNMRKSKISRERLLTEFRVRSIINLGMVQRAFLEANGEFTIYFFEEEEREGLCILPSWDKEFLDEMIVAEGTFACGGCGNTYKNDEEPKDDCKNCGQKQWFKAIKSQTSGE